MSAKMNKKLAVLCAAAVGSIYTAGYVVSNDMNNQITSSNQVKTTTSSTTSQANSQNNGQVYNFGHHHRDDSFQNGSSSNNNTQNNVQLNQTAQNTKSSANVSTQTAQSTKSTTTTSSKYKDGTYTGQATNRIGSVEVAVTFKSGKITDVEITNCDTHYPEDAISGLPSEVESRQSSNVDIVSGATLSSEDFSNAVSEAMAKAMA